MRLSRLFMLSWLLTAALVVASYPWLPDQVGDPGKTLDRAGYLAAMLLPLASAGLCSKAFVSWLGRVAPGQIKLPHRDYWLAEPRRQASLERLGEHLAGIGVLVVMSAAASHLAVLLSANPDWPQPPLPLVLLTVAAGLVGLLLTLWRLHRAFPAPPTAQPAAQPAPLRRPRRPGENR